jgi:uncharacterized protein YndB with AHSA1/START domain
MKIPPPVDQSVAVQIAPAEAFDIFTRQMRLWWPFAGHSCADDAEDVQFAARVGGAVTEISRSGQRHVWGCLTEWDPPHGFAMSWHPGAGPERASRLRVRFTAVAGGTEVHLVHDGWEVHGDAAQRNRDMYDSGWPGVLKAYAAAAADRASSVTGGPR